MDRLSGTPRLSLLCYFLNEAHQSLIRISAIFRIVHLVRNKSTGKTLISPSYRTHLTLAMFVIDHSNALPKLKLIAQATAVESRTDNDQYGALAVLMKESLMLGLSFLCSTMVANSLIFGVRH